MTKHPLGYERRYKIPILDFSKASETLTVQTADKDTEAYIKVRYEQWEQKSDPEISVQYVKGDTVNRYGFRVTRPNLLECSYKGDDPSELPTAVQHAVCDFGYNIQDIDSLNHWTFDAWEAGEIVNKLLQLEDQYEDEPLIKWLLESLLQVYSIIYTLLSVRAILGGDGYESLWNNVMADGPVGPNPAISLVEQFHKQAVDEVKAMGTNGIEIKNNGDFEINSGVVVTEYETTDGLYYFVDYATPLGTARCRFREVNEEEVVCEHPAEKHIPHDIVRQLDGPEKTIVNRDSIGKKETPTEILEYATVFAKEISNYSLTPESKHLPVNWGEIACKRAKKAEVVLTPYHLDQDLGAKFMDAISEATGLTSVRQLTEETATKMVGGFVSNLPQQMKEQWDDYIESNPSYKKRMFEVQTDDGEEVGLSRNF